MKPLLNAQNVSVIIPALNESQHIARLLGRLRAMSNVGDIVVCDGGSVDETREIAQSFGARVVACQANRGAQMNAGASVMHGDILWFLHADSLPPRSGAKRIVAACNRQSTHRVLGVRAKPIIGGNFRLRFGSPSSINNRKRERAGLMQQCHTARALPLAVVEMISFSIFASDVFNSQLVAANLFAIVARVLRSCGVYYGDSGIWMRRDVFEKIGGFQNWPLFEDLEMARQLELFARQNGCKTICIAPPIVVSSRRFGSSTRSATKLLARWAKLQTLFWLGVAPETLAKMYRGR